MSKIQQMYRTHGDLFASQPPAIDDQVLLSFLSTPAEGTFYDPGEVIAGRWRLMDPQNRRDWYLDVFSAFLKAGADRPGPVWVVAEPAVAALLFYGVARLLPAGSLRDGLSFANVPAPGEAGELSVAGTWPADPADSSPDSRLGEHAVDTRQPPAAEAQRLRSEYAVGTLRRLLEKGWDEVNWLLETLATIKVQRPEHLEALAGADRLVATLLHTGAFPNQNWRKSPAATAYLGKVLGRELSDPAGLAERLKAVVEGPAVLSVLDLIAAKSKDSPTRAATDYLLKSLPGEKLVGLLKLDNLPAADKLRALARYIEQHDMLPPKCEGLWEVWERAIKAKAPDKMGLMPHLLTRLPQETLKKFLGRMPVERSSQAVLGLLQMCALRAIKPVSLTPVIDALDQDAFVAVYHKMGPKLLEDYPADEPAMPRQLSELLRTLPQFPREFRDRLELLLAGQHLLDDREQRVVTAWANCRKGLESVGRLQAADGGKSDHDRVNLLTSATREMAMAADEGMSYARIECDKPEARKVDALKQIAKELLGKPLLPSATEHEFLWSKINVQFKNHQWPVESSPKKDVAGRGDAAKKDKGLPAKDKKESPKDAAHKEAAKRPSSAKAAPGAGWLGLVVVLVMIAIVGLIGGGIYYFIFGPGSKSSKGEKKGQSPEKKKRERKAVSYLPSDADPILAAYQRHVGRWLESRDLA